MLLCANEGRSVHCPDAPGYRDGALREFFKSRNPWTASVTFRRWNENETNVERPIPNGIIQDQHGWDKYSGPHLRIGYEMSKALKILIVSVAIVACVELCNVLLLEYRLATASRAELIRAVVRMNKELEYALEDLDGEIPVEEISLEVVQVRFNSRRPDTEGMGLVPELINNGLGPLGETLTIRVVNNVVEIRSSQTGGYVKLSFPANRGVFVRVEIGAKRQSDSVRGFSDHPPVTASPR